MTRKGPLSEKNIPAYKQFMALVGQLYLKTRGSSLLLIMATKPNYSGVKNNENINVIISRRPTIYSNIR